MDIESFWLVFPFYKDSCIGRINAVSFCVHVVIPAFWYSSQHRVSVGLFSVSSSRNSVLADFRVRGIVFHKSEFDAASRVHQPKHLELVWIVFRQERNRNTHHAVVVDRDVGHLVYLYGVVVVVFRVFVLRVCRL